MQNVKLPLLIDAKRAALKRLDYVGVYQAGQMLRLAQSANQINVAIDANVSFDIDKQRLTVIKGSASTVVELVCQRCGQLFTHPLVVDFCFSPVQDEQQIAALPEEYEPLETNEMGEIDLLAAIEDELILALPVVPIHDLTQCAISATETVFGEIPVQAEEEANPFAILAKLKHK